MAAAAAGLPRCDGARRLSHDKRRSTREAEEDQHLFPLAFVDFGAACRVCSAQVGSGGTAAPASSKVPGTKLAG